MHSFLRSIGFSKISNRKEMDVLIGKALHEPTDSIRATVSANTTLIQVNKDFGEDIGISIIGEYDEKGFLNIEYYFPYHRGNFLTVQDEIQIEKRTDKEAYAGICDDINIGVPLVFYLQNIMEYVKSTWQSEYISITDAYLSALSVKGTIILDINKNEEQVKSEKAGNQSRNNLLAAAKAGDIEAMESLTIEDMDMFTIISKRAKYEDIFTIVDSYFMPYGIESDQYSILGTINDVRLIENKETKELVYSLLVESNEINMNICINKMDLLGEPAIGRRFKGVIWLQGIIGI